MQDVFACSSQVAKGFDSSISLYPTTSHMEFNVSGLGAIYFWPQVLNNNGCLHYQIGLFTFLFPQVSPVFNIEASRQLRKIIELFSFTNGMSWRKLTTNSQVRYCIIIIVICHQPDISSTAVFHHQYSSIGRFDSNCVVLTVPARCNTKPEASW